MSRLVQWFCVLPNERILADGHRIGKYYSLMLANKVRKPGLEKPCRRICGIIHRV
jgi:hypothetical protein